MFLKHFSLSDFSLDIVYCIRLVSFISWGNLKVWTIQLFCLHPSKQAFCFNHNPPIPLTCINLCRGIQTIRSRGDFIERAEPLGRFCNQSTSLPLVCLSLYTFLSLAKMFLLLLYDALISCFSSKLFLTCMTFNETRFWYNWTWFGSSSKQHRITNVEVILHLRPCRILCFFVIV